MKIALVSDSHLGQKRLGFHHDGVNLIEQDNYIAIREMATSIATSDAELVLHAGDIFDKDNPSALAIKEFINFTRNTGKDMHMVAGNHDNRMLLETFESFVSANIYTDFRIFTVRGWTFVMLPHIDPSVKDGKRDYTEDYEIFAKIEESVSKLDKCILVTHGILESEANAYNINISEYNGSNLIPDRLLEHFDYCIIGHNHSPSIRNINKCSVIVPGSAIADMFKTHVGEGVFGLGALYLDLNTGKLSRDTFTPRDIKKLPYRGKEDDIDLEYAVKPGGIYRIQDYSEGKLEDSLLQQLRNTALLVSVEQSNPFDPQIVAFNEELKDIVDFARRWEKEFPGVSDSIRQDISELKN